MSTYQKKFRINSVNMHDVHEIGEASYTSYLDTIDDGEVDKASFTEIIGKEAYNKNKNLEIQVGEVTTTYGELTILMAAVAGQQSQKEEAVGFDHTVLNNTALLNAYIAGIS